MSDAGLKRGLDVGVMPEQGAGPGAMQGERRTGACGPALRRGYSLSVIPRLLFAVEEMKFLAGFETDGFAGGDGDFGSGAWVAADSGFARAHIEDAKTAQFDAVSSGQCLFEALKYGIDCRFGLVARQARTFDDVMDNVLFNQRVHPL